MSKYRKLTGVILKKQNYREADQIVTVWTKEAGKIRVLARSLRHSKSKLAYSFQDLSLVEMEIVGHSLPTLISAQVVQNFSNLRQDLIKIGLAFYASELMFKITADEHPNHPAFNLLVNFLEYLNSAAVRGEEFYPALESFSLKLLSVFGFGLEHATKTSFRIPSELIFYLNNLRRSEFDSAQRLAVDTRTGRQLHRTISKFIESVLERQLNSEQFLVSI